MESPDLNSESDRSANSIVPCRISSLTDQDYLAGKVNNAWSSIFESVSQSNLEETRGLLENGHSPKLSNVLGDTPLHIACKTNSVNIVKILLDYGANPNSINAVGITPLHNAVKYECLDTVKILLVYGADVNATEFDTGKTCFHFAAETKNKEIYDTLLKANANINVQDYLGNYPLMRLSLNHSIKYDDDYKLPCACDSCTLI